MQEFRGVDFYRCDDLLSEEEKMVRDTVREFVSEKVVPVMARHFEEATFPLELVPRNGQPGPVRCQSSGGVRLCGDE